MDLLAYHFMCWNLGLQERTHLFYKLFVPCLIFTQSLQQVQESWPSLSFSDFVGATSGSFETDLTVNGLKQAATNISQTKVMTERAEADSLGIADGTMLIGDSVALRANTALQTALPGAQINAQVSRTTKTANEIMLNNSQNKFLPKMVVIATGVNNPENYKEDWDSIVKIFLRGTIWFW